MKNRRKYDDQFKSDAVNLAMSSEKSISEVARELGIPNACLGRWKRDYLNTLDGDASEAGAEAMVFLCPLCIFFSCPNRVSSFLMSSLSIL